MRAREQIESERLWANRRNWAIMLLVAMLCGAVCYLCHARRKYRETYSQYMALKTSMRNRSENGEVGNPLADSEWDGAASYEFELEGEVCVSNVVARVF